MLFMKLVIKDLLFLQPLTKAWTIDDVTNISIITLDSEENVISNENTEDAEENENFEEEITENNEINEVSEQGNIFILFSFWNY